MYFIKTYDIIIINTGGKTNVLEKMWKSKKYNYGRFYENYKKAAAFGAAVMMMASMNIGVNAATSE